MVGITTILLFYPKLENIGMITYDPFWKMIAERGISQYDLEQTYGFNHYQLDRLRNNKPIKTDTIDFICKALDCKTQEVIEYREDN